MMRARGFSLIELMIAITLALIVTTGVISIFIGSRSAYNATSGTAQLTDGGRFALNFISTAVRGAGNMACTTAPLVQGILSPGATALTTSWTQALGGFEAVNTSGGTGYTIAPAPVAADATNTHWSGGIDTALASRVVQNNDVLVVRSTLGNAVPAYVQTIVDGAASFTIFKPAAAPPTLVSGQMAVISDCSKAVIFQITGLGLGANPTVTHNGGGGPPGNTVSAFPLSFPPGSQVTPVDTLAYYIGVGADGDGALFVYSSNATGAWTATELVPDIEAMQVLYGLDTNNSQTVSNYVTANQVGDFNTVMSVKVALLAASAPGAGRVPTAVTYNLLGTTVTPPADSRSRQVFEATIAVRNSLH
ncbi:MAG: type pilus assembly protein PilW [Gammaproteobacteria bacterium]|jgi:type IV pilus assembly protein PilW|nr:type pilus assembly protein PilW [Gammaproteobacteria bacterium]